jgi:hypothetical protein
MGGKKKKGGKKGKKGDADADREASEANAPQILEADRENYVILAFNLLNWAFMNFQQKFTENTHIFTIKKMLAERHGHLKDLKLCIGSYIEANEIVDEMLTLRECGLAGKPQVKYLDENNMVKIDESDVPVVQIYYDFKPADTGDPVLLFRN